MPLYGFSCPDCGQHRRLLAEGLPPAPLCLVCSARMERAAAGPTARVVEKIDTGIMPKALERLAEGPRLIRERNKARVEADKPPELLEKLK